MLNQCQFIGHLGADPEIKSTRDGKKIGNLRLAVTEKWRDQQGERREKTEWVSVVIFSEGLVGIAERYLRKGSKAFVSGKMATRKWQDQSGNDRYSTEIVLQGFDAKLVLLDGANGQRGDDGLTHRNQDGFGGRERPQQSRQPAYDDLDTDSVPF